MASAISTQNLSTVTVLPSNGHASTLADAPGRLRYIARQPILNARGNLHGYELLYRSGPVAGFSGDGDTATRSVLDSTVIFGLDNLSGGRPVFVNCTRESVLGRLVDVLPPSLAVLEILESLEPTPDLLRACHELKAAGFRLALDDFQWHPQWQPFAAIADYIKIDISIVGPEQRSELLSRLRGSPARLVAERVETAADLAQAREEGFTLFQGYYFCKPVLLQNREIPLNRLVHIELLQALHSDPLNLDRIESMVKRDASLTYRLLRLVNSPIFGMSQNVRSIRSALVAIGDDMFRRLATLAIATELGRGHPAELLRMALQRARFCELAAHSLGHNPTELYLLGILSLLPTMLRVPMETLVDSLPLRQAIRDALVGANNPEHGILQWMEHYERGEWDQCDQIGLDTAKSHETLPALYTESILWAENALRIEAI